MEKYFATIFEDVRHERSLILLISLKHSDMLKQSKVTDDERIMITNFAVENLHRHRILNEYVACSLLEGQFSNS